MMKVSFLLHTNISTPSNELKLEHKGQHTTVLDLNIRIQDNIFLCKLLGKRNTFPFFVVHMHYLPRNIPSSIFYILHHQYSMVQHF